MSQSIGKNIRKLRKERNLTQEELAERLNITSQAISKWRNETGMPDISLIIPLTSVFGVSTDLLFGISSTNEQNDVEKIIEDLHIKNKNLEIDDFEESIIIEFETKNSEFAGIKIAPLRAGFRFCVHESSACQEKQTDFRGAQTKGSLREGAPDGVG